MYSARMSDLQLAIASAGLASTVVCMHSARKTAVKTCCQFCIACSHSVCTIAVQPIVADTVCR